MVLTFHLHEIEIVDCAQQRCIVKCKLLNWWDSWRCIGDLLVERHVCVGDTIDKHRSYLWIIRAQWRYIPKLICIVVVTVLVKMQRYPFPLKPLYKIESVRWFVATSLYSWSVDPASTTFWFSAISKIYIGWTGLPLKFLFSSPCPIEWRPTRIPFSNGWRQSMLHIVRSLTFQILYTIPVDIEQFENGNLFNENWIKRK